MSGLTPLVLPASALGSWTTAFSEKLASLTQTLDSYLHAADVEKIQQAAYFGASAHQEQVRSSGEPYIFHPLAVAQILADIQLDAVTVQSALLHDVIEDTDISKADIASRFGHEVAEIVDGVSKLTQIKFASKQEAKAENFRKMIMAMSQDIRVILVKLADRLHNMRTLDALIPRKRRRIAAETLQIYAPIAARLSMNKWRIDLENLGFQHHYPHRYRVLQAALDRRAGDRAQIVSQIELRIRQQLETLGVEGTVSGREKHLWSLYCKFKEKRSLDDVFDIYAFRVVVENIDQCYRVLGVVHGLYKPIMGKFKDYIAIPKANGYQSLHTVVFGSHGLPVEIQIRTQHMHILAEAGVAAHWLYKNPESNNDSRTEKWVQTLVDMQRRTGDSQEFMESVTSDLFSDEIYVFTPKGKIIELARGSTVIDFAYAIHSDIGNTCVSARVNRQLVPLRTQLRNGQTVEIVTALTARPNPAWLNSVVTAKARSAIRHYLNHLQRDEAILIGRRLLNQVLLNKNISIAKLNPERLRLLLTDLNIIDLDTLLADLGFGKRLAVLIAKRLTDDEEPSKTSSADSQSDNKLLIKGTEGAMVTLARCCRPLPGDAIMGFISSGRGIAIHRDTCKYVADYRKHPEKWIEVEWEKDVVGHFPVELQLIIDNTQGVFAEIAVIINSLNCNIEHIETLRTDADTLSLSLTLHVATRLHLAQLLRRLRATKTIQRIQRG